MRSGPAVYLQQPLFIFPKVTKIRYYVLFNLLRKCLHEHPVSGRGACSVHPAPPTLCLRLCLPPKHKDLKSQAQGHQQQCHPPHCLNYLFLSNKPEPMSRDRPRVFPVLVTMKNPGQTPGCPAFLGPVPDPSALVTLLYFLSLWPLHPCQAPKALPPRCSAP